MRKLIQIGDEKAAHFDGILMRANPHLHAEAFDQLQKIVPPGTRAIDVGAGQGAFSKRLAQNGYGVLSVDIDPTDYMADPIPFEKVDFNDQAEVAAFCARHVDEFDVAIGMEVIEHVQNPWEYLKLLRGLVKPGGVIFVTTPNIESSMSKLHFLFTGHHLHFDHHDLRDSGHINPLTLFEISYIAKSLRLEVIKAADICAMPKFVVSRSLGGLLRSCINLLFGWSFGDRRSGDILFVALKRID